MSETQKQDTEEEAIRQALAKFDEDFEAIFTPTKPADSGEEK